MSHSEKWQDCMSSAELAQFNSDPDNYVVRSSDRDENIEVSEHPYANIHEDPSTSEGQVELIENLHLASPDLERQEYLFNCLELVDGFSDLPAKCHLCGKRMLTGSKAERYTLVKRSKANEYVPETRVYCLSCLDAPEPRTGEQLTPRQRKARKLFADNGMTHDEIAKELKVSQSTITRDLQKAIM
jgi:hypothetical protein